MSYDDYVKDGKFLEGYNEYQRRYSSQIPERDKVTLKLIEESARKPGAKILDIGCSTGNLLLHLKRAFPQAQLFGGELAESSLEVARRNEELRSVTLETMNMLSIPRRGEFDVVISNAVTYLFNDEEFQRAANSVHGALRAGGIWIDFDWFSPFVDQRVTINEVSPSHPDGLNIHVRTEKHVTSVLASVGFKSAVFEPFEIGIDLPFKGLEGNPISYTKRTDEGKRIQFRGVLYQPWCHLVAQR